MPGFEGGQTPLYRRLRKYGEFSNKMFKRTDYQVLNLGQLQNFVDRGFLDVSKRVTMRDLYVRACVKKRKRMRLLLSPSLLALSVLHYDFVLGVLHPAHVLTSSCSWPPHAATATCLFQSLPITAMWLDQTESIRCQTVE
jgi:Ribosomal proteins 50S-L15, 50S-L18e, 60S-L27A